jgi:hypothetical protein
VEGLLSGGKTEESEVIMGLLRNDKGLAMLMVMVLSAIALVVISGLIYMTTSGTSISGMQKRYKTALEAGEGGIDVSYQLIDARGNPNITGLGLVINASSACLTDKLTKATSNWTAGCDSSRTIDITNATTYDTRFDIGSYRVYSKIADTVDGNSGGVEGLVKTGVVVSNPGEVPVKSVPYLYTLEVDVRNQADTAEKARISALYQY